MRIPQAMGSSAALEGAYRLFHNQRVTLDKLTEAYAKATAERAREVGRVLAIHDTTTCEFAHADAEDVGYLSTGRAGFMAHYCLVVAADDSRRPLGIVNVEAIFVIARRPRRRETDAISERSAGAKAATIPTANLCDGCEVLLQPRSG